MSRVNTNFVSLRYTIETSLGVAGTSWRLLEPNDITSYGATIETVARRPISTVRGRRKGVQTKLSSEPAFEADLTMASLDDFLEGFMFSEFANVEFDLTVPKVKNGALNVTTTGYAFGAALSTFTNGALLAGKMVFAASGAITLVQAKGYALAANNGLKALNADVTAASTEVTVTGLATETAPAGAKLFVAGVRNDDLTLTISGLTATLVSAADVTNWATFGLRAGQFIHIGSGTALGAVQNAYASNAVFGYARITSISGGTLNLDKLDPNITGGPHASGTTIDVMFGRFSRDVTVDSAADDSRFLERSYQLEASYPNLGGVGVTEFEYAVGNFANELSLKLSLQDKAVATWGFVGTNSEAVTATRKTGASTAVAPVRTVAVGTMTNLPILTTTLASAVTDVCFQDLTLGIKNNMATQSCLGKFAPDAVNSGLFEVNLEGQMLFENKSITNAIRGYTTVTSSVAVANEDGAAMFDIPSMTFGDGSREFPVDESVKVNIKGESFTDTTFGYNLGVSLFANVPTIRP